MSEKQIYPAPPALGPGDSARQERRQFPAAPNALGPGDGLREKPAPRPAPRAAGPGDGDGDEFEGVALPPLGPGDLQVPRPVVRRRRRQQQQETE